MIRVVKSDWSDAILVCGKCSRKQKGGFGAKGKDHLAKLLRKTLGGKKGRKGKLGVLETRCLGICPKHAVTVISGQNPKQWLLVEPGMPIETIVSALAPIDQAAE